MILAPLRWIVDSEWWEEPRSHLTAGFDQFSRDYWSTRAPVPVKRSKRR